MKLMPLRRRLPLSLKMKDEEDGPFHPSPFRLHPSPFARAPRAALACLRPEVTPKSNDGGRIDTPEDVDVNAQHSSLHVHSVCAGGRRDKDSANRTAAPRPRRSA